MKVNNFLIVDGKVCPQRWWALMCYTLEVMDISMRSGSVSEQDEINNLVLARYAHGIPGNISIDVSDIPLQQVLAVANRHSVLSTWRMVYEAAPTIVEIFNVVPEIVALNEYLYDLAEMIITYNTLVSGKYLTLPDKTPRGIPLLHFYHSQRTLYVGLSGVGVLKLHAVKLNQKYEVEVRVEPYLEINTVNVPESRFEDAYGISKIDIK